MKKIFVAGHRGMVGSAICRQLQKKSDVEIITRTRDELDLCDQQQFMRLCNQKSLTKLFLQRQRWEAFTQIIPTPQSLFIRTFKSKTMSSMQRTCKRRAEITLPWLVLYLPTSSGAADARRSPSDWVLEPTTNPMRSQRLQASRCARAIIVSMAGTIAP